MAEGVMAACCCSCYVHFNLTAPQLLSQRWADSTDCSFVYTTLSSNYPLHQVCVIYFMHVNLVTIISFIMHHTNSGWLLLKEFWTFVKWFAIHSPQFVSYCSVTPYGASCCPCVSMVSFELVSFNLSLHQCHSGRCVPFITFLQAI